MNSSFKNQSDDQTNEIEKKPLALVIWAQPGYDEKLILDLVKNQSAQFIYKQIIICQQVDRDFSTEFLQTLLKEKPRKQFNLWDNDSEFNFKDRINRLSKKFQIHLLLLTAPEELQELELVFRHEKYYQDFPEETSPSLIERISSYKALYKEMLNALALINRVWVYSRNKHCLYQNEYPLDKKELKNLLANNEPYKFDTQYQQQFLERSKNIIVWQKLRGASSIDIDDFLCLYNKYRIKDTHPDFDELYSIAINDYLISSELDLAHKVERWTKALPLADRMMMELISNQFKNLNEKNKDIKTKDLFLLATAFGNHLKNEN